jgi:hypothetical protein
LIALVCFWHLLAVRLNGDNWKYVIASDGAGYYAYLPATFIYQDLTYQFAEVRSPAYRSYPGCDISLFGNISMEGKRVNKYFIGTAILQAPFFLTAHFLSSVFDYPPGGYSYLYQAFICLAAIFYMLAGLYFMRKLLLGMKFSDTTAMVVMLVIFFGTNLYRYGLEEPSMSHVYSFGTISFFLWNVFKLNENYSGRRIVITFVTLALIVLIRPTNGIIALLVPFLVDRENFKLIFKKVIADKKALLLSVIIPFLLFFLQALTWKLSGGHWTEDTYVGESLDLSHPHIMDVLFSWRKGLFIYTPLLLFSVAGALFIRPIYKAWFFIAFLVINIWIISSWHDWSYGGSFGMRPFIDTYAVAGIGLAFFLRRIENTIAKAGIAIIAAFFVFLNLFQVYQYHQGILPYEYMTWNKYKRIFLKSDNIFAGIYSPGKENAGNLPENCKLLKTFSRNFDHDEYINQTGVIYDVLYYSPHGAARLDDKTKLCGDLFVPVASGIPDSSTADIWIKASAKICLDEDATNAKMVIAFKDEKNDFEWNGFYIVHRIGEIKSWQEYSYAIPLPKTHSPTELVSIYILKDDDKLLYIDDLEISFWKAPVKNK